MKPEREAEIKNLIERMDLDQLPAGEMGPVAQALADLWEDRGSTSRLCRSGLMLHGEFFGCDWPTSGPDNDHVGWAHTNKQAGAVWQS